MNAASEIEDSAIETQHGPRIVVVDSINMDLEEYHGRGEPN